jgi:hypothetical protein
VIVRRAGVADAAVLAELRGIARLADRPCGDAPAVRRRCAVDFYLRNGFSRHRQFLLWEPAAD